MEVIEKSELRSRKLVMELKKWLLFQINHPTPP